MIKEIEQIREKYARMLAEQLAAIPSLEARAVLLGIVFESVLLHMIEVRGPRATATFLSGVVERIEADARERMQ